MVITSYGLLVLIFFRTAYTASVSGINCKDEKVVAYIEAVSGNREDSGCTMRKIA
jgi:hypothetical protein